MNSSPIRLDFRFLLPASAFLIVVIVIFFVELCGRQDTPNVKQLVAQGAATGTAAPTFTPGPSPTPGPTAAATAAPGVTVPPNAPGTGEERDTVRQGDLEKVRAALEQYKTKNDKYPSSSGGTQSLCVYVDNDAGCKLRDFLDPLPEDPLGEPAKNGYFYTSDGKTYTVYAQREGTLLAECPVHPEHLKGFKSIYCVQGP